MASCALDTAVRNIIASGGTLSELAILDNFCWCSSYEGKRLGQLVDSLKACYELAVGYGTPFISGKDSMFNDFKGYDEKGNPVAISIPPTLLISAISIMKDLHKTVSPEFKNAGDIIYLLGETHDELGGGEYFKMLSGKTNSLGNNVPKVNIEKNLKTYLALEKVIQKELLASSMSITLGGLGIALTKACVGGMVGVNVSLDNVCGSPSSADQYGGNSSVLDVKLFSESQGRILVSVSPQNVKKFENLVKDIFCTKLGKVQKNGKIVMLDGKIKIVDINVKKLHTIYHKFSNSME
jgi:phosphoribosylformylglycinamidine synthase